MTQKKLTLVSTIIVMVLIVGGTFSYLKWFSFSWPKAAEQLLANQGWKEVRTSGFFTTTQKRTRYGCDFFEDYAAVYAEGVNENSEPIKCYVCINFSATRAKIGKILDDD